MIDSGIQNVQPIRGDAIECGIVQDHHRVDVFNQPLHGQYGVVWLDDDIA